MCLVSANSLPQFQRNNSSCALISTLMQLFRATFLNTACAVADVVKIVGHHPSTNGESGYSIEVFNAVSDTIAVTAVPQSALESPAACFRSSLVRRRSHSLAEP